MPGIRKGQKPGNIDIASVEFIFTKLCSKILIPKRLDVLQEFFSLISLEWINFEAKNIHNNGPCTTMQIKTAGSSRSKSRSEIESHSLAMAEDRRVA